MKDEKKVTEENKPNKSAKIFKRILIVVISAICLIGSFFAGFVLRDVRVLLNSIDHQLDLVRAAGVGASRERQETEQEIGLTSRIPKSKASLSRSR